MTSVGLSTFLTTLAMVKVLPEPVTPSKVLMFHAGHDAVGQLRNGLRLVTGGFVGRDEFKHGGQSRA